MADGDGKMTAQKEIAAALNGKMGAFGMHFTRHARHHGEVAEHSNQKEQGAGRDR